MWSWFLFQWYCVIIPIHSHLHTLACACGVNTVHLFVYWIFLTMWVLMDQREWDEKDWEMLMSLKASYLPSEEGEGADAGLAFSGDAQDKNQVKALIKQLVPTSGSLHLLFPMSHLLGLGHPQEPFRQTSGACFNAFFLKGASLSKIPKFLWVPTVLLPFCWCLHSIASPFSASLFIYGKLSSKRVVMLSAT